MADYIRVGNRSMHLKEFTQTAPEQIKKIENDAALAEKKRQDNIIASLGFQGQKQTMTFTPDVRPGSDMLKAIVEDAKALVPQVSEEVIKKPKGGRPKKVKVVEAVQEAV